MLQVKSCVLKVAPAASYTRVGEFAALVAYNLQKHSTNPWMVVGWDGFSGQSMLTPSPVPEVSHRLNVRLDVRQIWILCPWKHFFRQFKSRNTCFPDFQNNCISSVAVNLWNYQLQWKLWTERPSQVSVCTRARSPSKECLFEETISVHSDYKFEFIFNHFFLVSFRVF